MIKEFLFTSNSVVLSTVIKSSDLKSCYCHDWFKEWVQTSWKLKQMKIHFCKQTWTKPSNTRKSFLTVDSSEIRRINSLLFQNWSHWTNIYKKWSSTEKVYNITRSCISTSMLELYIYTNRYCWECRSPTILCLVEEVFKEQSLLCCWSNYKSSIGRGNQMCEKQITCWACFEMSTFSIALCRSLNS